VIIHSSPLGAALVGTVHAAAVLAAFVALPAWSALVCASGIVLSAAVHVAGSLQWSRKSVRELTLRPDGAATWRDGDGVWHPAREVTGAVIAPWLVVIGLRGDGWSMRPLLLLPDALPREALREVRVWLRWRPPPARRASVI
jgi:hypothetical protein